MIIVIIMMVLTSSGIVISFIMCFGYCFLFIVVVVAGVFRALGAEPVRTTKPFQRVYG